MKKATARPAIGIWTERVSTRTKLSSSHKMFIANRDGWRVCRMRNSMHDSQQKAAEYHNLAAHAHRTAAVHQGQEDHLTGHEHSRQALEHSNTWIRREFRCFPSKVAENLAFVSKMLQQSLDFHKHSFSPPGVLSYESGGVSHPPAFE